MSPWRKILAAWLLTFGLADGLAGAELLAARVIILANANDPESWQVAQHYADQRNVPRANIVALAMPRTETITWPEFVTTIWQPLQDELVRRKWIDAILEPTVDSVGRKTYAISGHRLAYLVVCRGVPLRIGHAPGLYMPRALPYDRIELRTNAGAVDSELSLLAQSNYPINGFIGNPLFKNDHPSEWSQAQVVKVSRLDGPTVAEAMALVDHAMEAERVGLLGRAYVDLGYPLPEGNEWLEAAAAQLVNLGFDLDVDRARATLPATARFDAPVFYFGWYKANLDGPFSLPGFHFPAGAVAVHLHSYSASTLRSPSIGWCGPFVARGVTATVGNVFEPYLDFLHRPDLLLRALARGETFGDAAYYAEPVLSWQAIAIGDPLYRPFAKSFAEQWRDRHDLPTRLAGYAALRKFHLLEAKQLPAEARRVAEVALRDRPDLALAFSLARRRELAGDLTGATRELALAVYPTVFQTDEWALAQAAARLLARGGLPRAAEQLYATLLRERTLPADWRTALLREANQVAEVAGDHPQALAWAQELGQLDPTERN